MRVLMMALMAAVVCFSGAQPLQSQEPNGGAGRLRGVMYGPDLRPGDLETLAREWGANQIRWQMNWSPMDKAEQEWAVDLDRYDAWLQGAIVEADKAAAECERLGIHMLLDLHTAPGGRDHGTCRMFSSPHYQRKLIEVWRKLATHFKDRKAIYAYDILNEAVEGKLTTGALTWREIATSVTREIRAIDPARTIVFEPSPLAKPAAFADLQPLPEDNIVYSVHVYVPPAYTHQGVNGKPKGYTYPGMINQEYWNKDRLRASLRPVVEFQHRYNVPIYVGEFSAVRWAPGNDKYLSDVIELFEEYQWDWSYHAYREWSGWSVEHSDDPAVDDVTTVPTARKLLLQKWLRAARAISRQ
jgi:aryl-phospho-beta-D-glucosidase BglC (GH1 family)